MNSMQWASLINPVALKIPKSLQKFDFLHTSVCMLITCEVQSAFLMQLICIWWRSQKSIKGEVHRGLETWNKYSMVKRKAAVDVCVSKKKISSLTAPEKVKDKLQKMWIKWELNEVKRKWCDVKIEEGKKKIYTVPRWSQTPGICVLVVIQ